MRRCDAMRCDAMCERGEKVLVFVPLSLSLSFVFVFLSLSFVFCLCVLSPCHVSCWSCLDQCLVLVSPRLGYLTLVFVKWALLLIIPPFVTLTLSYLG